DGILKRADVENVGDFVRSLAGVAPDPKADLTAGKKIFSDNCAVCHGETGKGKRELGAPNLSDAIWLYGADKPSIVEAIWNGRGGVMPAWAARLDDVTIKALAVYVHSLGGGGINAKRSGRDITLALHAQATQPPLLELVKDAVSAASRAAAVRPAPDVPEPDDEGPLYAARR